MLLFYCVLICALLGVRSFQIYNNLNSRWNPPIMSQLSDKYLQDQETIISNNQTTVSYSKKQVMLNVAKQGPSEAYRVKLPKGDNCHTSPYYYYDSPLCRHTFYQHFHHHYKGMELPTLSKKEQVVSDRRKESLELDSTKSDLDLMKEELQKIIDKMSE